MSSRIAKYKQYYKDGVLLKMIYRKLVNKTRSFWIWIMKMFPINSNKVCFDSFEGTGFGGDPKYICLELMKQRPGLEIIWFVRKKMDNFPIGIKQVYIDGITAIYHQSTAKVWVDNTRTGHRTKKRAGQYYLQTWHGGVVGKKVEKDAEDKLWPEYIPVAKYDGEITDAIIASNLPQEQVLRNSFWLNINTEILRIGSPSNDLFFGDHKSQFIASIKEKLSIDENVYTVLYAPTFRDDKSEDGYIKDFEKILDAFKNKYNSRCVLLLRFHPDMAKSIPSIKNNKNIINVTNYPDVKELSLVSDCLITDYSSILYDFLLMRKPVYRLCLDFDLYMSIRDVYSGFYDIPYEIIKTMDGLYHSIDVVDSKSIIENIDNYNNKYHIFEDGKSTLNAANWVLEKIES